MSPIRPGPVTRYGAGPGRRPSGRVKKVWEVDGGSPFGLSLGHPLA